MSAGVGPSLPRHFAKGGAGVDWCTILDSLEADEERVLRQVLSARLQIRTARQHLLRRVLTMPIKHLWKHRLQEAQAKLTRELNRLQRLTLLKIQRRDCV